MKGFKKLALAFVLVIGLIGLVGCSSSETSDGKVDAKIILVLKDGKEVPYDIKVTKDASLRDALYEAKLISEETYGAFFIEDIDGHVANVEKDGCTWLICDKDGKQLENNNFDEAKISGGETYILKYYKVPDMD